MSSDTDCTAAAWKAAENLHRFGACSVDCVASIGSIDSIDVQSVDSNGCTLLHHAARAGCVPLIKALLGRGINADAIDSNGWSASALSYYHGHMLSVAPLLPPDHSTAPVNASEYVNDQPINFLDSPAPPTCDKAVPTYASTDFGVSTTQCSVSVLIRLPVSLSVFVRFDDAEPVRMQSDASLRVSPDEGGSSNAPSDLNKLVVYRYRHTIAGGRKQPWRIQILIEQNSELVIVAEALEYIAGTRTVCDFGTFALNQGRYVDVSCLGTTQSRLIVRLGHPTQEVKHSPVKWSAAEQSISSFRISVGGEAELASSTMTLTDIQCDSLHQSFFSCNNANIDAMCTVCIEVLSASGSVLGRAFTDPSVLLQFKDGALSLPVIRYDGKCHVGTLYLEYLLVTALPSSWSTPLLRGCRLFSNQTRVWGHRGCGAENASVDRVHARRRLQMNENTLHGFEIAAAVAPELEYVEFDVMLTADDVPVIFHDYDISAEPLLARRHASHHQSTSTQMQTRLCSQTAQLPENIVRVPLNALSLRQFKALHQHIPLSLSSGGLVRDDFGVGLSSTRPDSIPAKEYLSYIQAECPTFAELLQFKQSDDMLSFNCEVKYPSQLEKKQFNLHVRERNFYVDLILKCIAEHAGPHRRIVFSSFDPDICTMLALKQSRYPVFFLTEAGGEIYCDPRLNSLHQASRFAVRAGLYGLVTYVSPLLSSSSCVRGIKCNVECLLTWGGQNNVPELVEKQIAFGVDVAIADHMQLLRSQMRV